MNSENNSNNGNRSRRDLVPAAEIAELFGVPLKVVNVWFDSGRVTGHRRHGTGERMIDFESAKRFHESRLNNVFRQ